MKCLNFRYTLDVITPPAGVAIQVCAMSISPSNSCMIAIVKTPSTNEIKACLKSCRVML